MLNFAAASDSRSARKSPNDLEEVERFGSNPGGLRMFTYAPPSLPRNAPLVVVLHGGTQTARDYARGSGWVVLANRHQFALLFPQQRPSNNIMGCFHWYRARDIQRDHGEARSIRQMVDKTCEDRDIDRRAIFVTGLSAGGAMANVMLATYPEVFAGGGIIAGLAYGIASNISEAARSMAPGSQRSGLDLGNRVRAASLNTNVWPRISVWHGDADTTVMTVNSAETVKQWLNVHGLAGRPTYTENKTSSRRQVWCDSAGQSRVELYEIARMEHGTPVAPGDEDANGGARGSYFVDVGVSSSYHLASFWGLLKAGAA